MRRLMLFLFTMILAAGLAAQELNDFRSVRNGNWDTLSTWQRWDGSAWVTPAARPTDTANNILIRSPHTVTVTINVAADQLIVESGATLKINSGNFTVFNGPNTPDVRVLGTLLVTNTGAVTSSSSTLWMDGVCNFNRNGGNLPLASWRTNSTLLLTGLTTALPGNRNQTFFNMTWNCPNQTAQLNTLSTNFRNFNGLLKVVDTGTGAWVWTNVTNSTKTINSWEQTGGTVIMNSGTASIVAYIQSAFTMSGGLLTETGTATGCAWVFQQPGIIFDKTGGTISEAISFSVNNNASLDILRDPLTGGGSFTLSHGGTLIIHDPAGITQTANAGAVQVTGTRTYNTGASYVFAGSEVQNTGDGLPAIVYDLTVDNPMGVVLTNPVSVTNTLYVLSGCFCGDVSTDGYYSPIVNSLTIESSGESITDLGVAVSFPTLYPQKINKAWTLSGTFNGSKAITFYWSANDDVFTHWDGNGWAPAAYNGNEKYWGYYDVSGDPRWLTIYVDDTLDKGLWTIGRDDENTLPVELSTFTAQVNSTNNIVLRWTTQSESNLSGYYILRSQSSDLDQALKISPLIAATNNTYGSTYMLEDKEVEPGLWYYWLESLEYSGESEYFGPISQTLIDIALISVPAIPVVTRIHSVFPNPFNPVTTIFYSLDRPSTAKFKIYNTRGQFIREINVEFRGIGNYSISWDGRDASGVICPTGVYLINMQAGDKQSRAKVVMKK